MQISIINILLILDDRVIVCKYNELKLLCHLYLKLKIDLKNVDAFDNIYA